jgi:hypothetical protein
VSVSFGILQGNRPFSQTRTVAINGTDAASAAVLFDEAPPAGLEVTADIVGGELTVTMTVDRKFPPGDYSGDIVVTGTDSGVYLIPFWVRVTQR